MSFTRAGASHHCSIERSNNRTIEQSKDRTIESSNNRTSKLLSAKLQRKTTPCTEGSCAVLHIEKNRMGTRLKKAVEDNGTPCGKCFSAK